MPEYCVYMLAAGHIKSRVDLICENEDDTKER